MSDWFRGILWHKQTKCVGNFHLIALRNSHWRNWRNAFGHSQSIHVYLWCADISAVEIILDFVLHQFFIGCHAERCYVETVENSHKCVYNGRVASAADFNVNVRIVFQRQIWAVCDHIFIFELHRFPVCFAILNDKKRTTLSEWRRLLKSRGYVMLFGSSPLIWKPIVSGSIGLYTSATVRSMLRPARRFFALTNLLISDTISSRILLLQYPDDLMEFHQAASGSRCPPIEDCKWFLQNGLA